MIANFINAPVEAAVRKYYLNDAIALLRSHPSIKVIGITGSYGKTSTKYYLHTLLSEKYDVLMTPGSYNTPMGVVKTIRSSLRATHEVFICEMGAKYVGDIKELCEIVEPEVGLITSIGAQHLDTFGSLENIVKTKLELSDFISGKGGRVFINGDCQLLLDNASGSTVCSSSSEADYITGGVSANEHGTSFKIMLKDNTELEITAKVLGAHNVSNLALAAAVAYEMGLSPDEIKRGARRIESAPHRLQLLHRGNDIIIDDAYNANPAGTKAALDALSLFDGYRIIVTPGMIELGNRSEEFNKSLGKHAAKVCDKIILVGKRQTESIYRGATEAGYPEARIAVYESVTDALNAAFSTQSDTRKIILIENDLPDNY
jgi:UDP-N-acetylmuramoyl-tripeptide--D-alanyl-D-alanine ligase